LAYQQQGDDKRAADDEQKARSLDPLTTTELIRVFEPKTERPLLEKLEPVLPKALKPSKFAETHRESSQTNTANSDLEPPTGAQLLETKNLLPDVKKYLAPETNNPMPQAPLLREPFDRAPPNRSTQMNDVPFSDGRSPVPAPDFGRDRPTRPRSGRQSASPLPSYDTERLPREKPASPDELPAIPRQTLGPSQIHIGPRNPVFPSSDFDSANGARDLPGGTLGLGGTSAGLGRSNRVSTGIVPPSMSSGLGTSPPGRSLFNRRSTPVTTGTVPQPQGPQLPLQRSVTPSVPLLQDDLRPNAPMPAPLPSDFDR
jgi:hypothetical protein